MAGFEFLWHREFLSLAIIWIIRFCAERSVDRMGMEEWNLILYMLKVVNNTTRYKKNVYSNINQRHVSANSWPSSG